MRTILYAILALFALSAPAGAYEWSYSTTAVEVPPQVIMGDTVALETWRDAIRPGLRQTLAAPPVPTPTGSFDGGWVQFPGYKLLQVVFTWPADSILAGKTVGGFLAVPDATDPQKPLVIALHGHEVAHRGEPPAKLFVDHWWPEQLVQAGYVVWAPSHLLYSQLASLYGPYDYHMVWTEFVSVTLDAVANRFPAHNGYAVAGLSAGGTTGSFLMALRDDIDCGVFAGSLLPLDFLRRNYRIDGHPNNWDVRGVNSYLPFYTLMAPRPVQFQMGMQDSFYPDGVPFAPQPPSFAGTPRDVTAPEMMGEYLAMQRMWSTLGGRAGLLIHSGAHELNVPGALDLLAACHGGAQ